MKTNLPAYFQRQEAYLPTAADRELTPEYAIGKDENFFQIVLKICNSIFRK